MRKKLFPFLVVLMYLLFALWFVKGILLTPGILMGGDWGFPLTKVQMIRYFQSAFFTWTDREILGFEQFFLNGIPFSIVIGALARLGITGDVYTKLLLIFAFTFPATALYAFCRFLKCSRPVSFLGGYLYMTLPIFYNYAAMGWLFVLISMGVLPLFLMSFIKSVQEEKPLYAVLAGILYSLAMIQSQSLIWYPITLLCFLPYLTTGKRGFHSYIRSLLAVAVVFLLINAYWYLPVLFGGGTRSLNTNLAASTISLGTWSRLSSVNMVRVWGSLFNEQYESSTENILAILSFVLPVVAFSSLLFVKNKRLISSLILMTFVPIILFKLGPSVIVRLPFSDLIRDIARFLVLPSFAVTVLAILSLNALLYNQHEKMRRAGMVAIIFLIAATYPFWRGELYGTPQLPHDVRLRTYDFSPDYETVENELVKDPEDAKVLYLPIAGELSLRDDLRFYGTYRGIRDISASFSPKQGMVGLSDRVKGLSKGLVTGLAEGSFKKRIATISSSLNIMNVKYVVVRKNMTHPEFAPGTVIAETLKQLPDLELIQDLYDIAVFKNNNYLPHIYIPDSVHINEGDTARGSKPAVFYASQNSHSPESMRMLTTMANSPRSEIPEIEYHKINPTRFEITVRNAKKPFPLVFLEAHHDRWKLYPSKDTWSTRPLSESRHLAANGYANAWVIDPQNQHGTYVIEFLPQRYFYIGSIMTFIGTFLIAGYILFQMIKNLLHKKHEK